MCMYLCTYVRMYVCMYVRTYVCMYACMVIVPIAVWIHNNVSLDIFKMRIQLNLWSTTLIVQPGLPTRIQCLDLTALGGTFESHTRATSCKMQTLLGYFFGQVVLEHLHLKLCRSFAKEKTGKLAQIFRERSIAPLHNEKSAPEPATQAMQINIQVLERDCLNLASRDHK